MECKKPKEIIEDVIDTIERELMNSTSPVTEPKKATILALT